MSKSLTFTDLQEQGLVLTKAEAMQLQPHVSKISQHGSDVPNAVEFGAGSVKTTEHQKQSNTGAANNVQQSAGFTPTKPAEPIEQKKLVAGNFRGKPGEKLKEEGYVIGDMYPRLEETKAEAEPETVDFAVTQEYLDEHPDEVTSGKKVGDIIQVPKAAETV